MLPDLPHFVRGMDTIWTPKDCTFEGAVVVLRPAQDVFAFRELVAL